MENYLSELNEQQLSAATHIDGPLMIVAGAGSGKTKVLTTRIAHLIHSGTPAFNILALTFTNKAAKEMKNRVENVLLDHSARSLHIGTFHSVFARVLRGEAPKIGFPNDFTIYDTDDAKSVVKAVINELKLDDKHYKPSAIYSRISHAKNALISPSEYAEDISIQNEDIQTNRPAIAQIYAAYVVKCFKNGAMDFDDLMIKFYELLVNFPEALEKYQNKFKYILVDEYQDTNPAQYAIIKMLGAKHENICVVGDDAQSIYSFRGATIENILRFQSDYSDVRIIKLERNYRSSQNILSVANEVIKKNVNQIPKVLWTENTVGDKIQVVGTTSDNEEGQFIVNTIMKEKKEHGYKNLDFAVLYRTNAQSRSFEESLRRMNIPYTLFGGISFYQRKEIKDVLAYMRVVVNPNDEEALRRIINYPARGIGKTSIDRLILAANLNNVRMWDVLEKASQYGFKRGTLEAIEKFLLMINSFKSMLATEDAYSLGFHIIQQSNIAKELSDDKSYEGVQRYENVQELLNSIQEWTDTPNEDGDVSEKGLGLYLQQISLLTDADKHSEDADTVKLMTIHSAKGLEFNCVFAAGVEESIFPSIMSSGSNEGLEEERRLFYVVITRAIKKLWITYANTRYKFGTVVSNEPSRFIDEMPEQYLAREDEESGITHKSNFTSSAYDRLHGSGWGSSNNEVDGPNATVPKFEGDDLSKLQSGATVEHAKFGLGKVLSLEGVGINRKALIDFNTWGKKNLMLGYVRLKIK